MIEENFETVSQAPSIKGFIRRPLTKPPFRSEGKEIHVHQFRMLAVTGSDCECDATARSWLSQMLPNSPNLGRKGLRNANKQQ